MHALQLQVKICPCSLHLFWASFSHAEKLRMSDSAEVHGCISQPEADGRGPFRDPICMLSMMLQAKPRTSYVSPASTSYGLRPPERWVARESCTLFFASSFESAYHSSLQAASWVALARSESIALQWLALLCHESAMLTRKSVQRTQTTKSGLMWEAIWR